MAENSLKTSCNKHKIRVYYKSRLKRETKEFKKTLKKFKKILDKAFEW